MSYVVIRFAGGWNFGAFALAEALNSIHSRKKCGCSQSGRGYLEWRKTLFASGWNFGTFTPFKAINSMHSQTGVDVASGPDLLAYLTHRA